MKKINKMNISDVNVYLEKMDKDLFAREMGELKVIGRPITTGCWKELGRGRSWEEAIENMSQNYEMVTIMVKKKTSETLNAKRNKKLKTIEKMDIGDMTVYLEEMDKNLFVREMGELKVIGRPITTGCWKELGRGRSWEEAMENLLRNYEMVSVMVKKKTI